MAAFLWKQYFAILCSFTSDNQSDAGIHIVEKGKVLFTFHTGVKQGTKNFPKTHLYQNYVQFLLFFIVCRQATGFARHSKIATMNNTIITVLEICGYLI